MPRKARAVFSNILHHITQRGNRREEVFFTDEDREKYPEWLKEYCRKHRVEILAYCLMTNHIHLVVVPATESGLQDVFKPLHMRYAQLSASIDSATGKAIYGRGDISHRH